MSSRGSTTDPTAHGIYPALCIQPGLNIWDNRVGLCVNLELVVGVCRFLELRNMSTVPAGYGTGNGEECFHEHCLLESAQHHLPGLTLSLWPPAQLKMCSTLTRDYTPLETQGSSILPVPSGSGGFPGRGRALHGSTPAQASPSQTSCWALGL